MSNLEARNYVATENDIDRLANDVLSAQGHLDTLPRVYLRAVVATTIHELGASIRARAGKVEKINDEEQTRQLAALEKVLVLFYPRIVAKMSEGLPAGKTRAVELNRRTNWARGAARDVRNWIRAGRSLTTLAPVRLTKAMLAVQSSGSARPASPGRIKARVERESKAVVARVMELAAVDRDSAITEIRLLMGQLTGQLEELGVKATKDPRTAAQDHLPLRVGKNVFFPTETQVIRQMERPS